jgi:hypothetical protein
VETNVQHSGRSAAFWAAKIDACPTNRIKAAKRQPGAVRLRKRLPLGSTMPVKPVSVSMPSGIPLANGHDSEPLFQSRDRKGAVVNSNLTRRTFLASAGGAVLTAQPKPGEIVSLDKIWDLSPHQAFTDLLFHQTRYFCVFRGGKPTCPKTAQSGC